MRISRQKWQQPIDSIANATTSAQTYTLHNSRPSQFFNQSIFKQKQNFVLNTADGFTDFPSLTRGTGKLEVWMRFLLKHETGEGFDGEKINSY